MNRRDSLKLVLAVAAALATGAPRAPAAPTTRPNIVFILTDDMGVGDPACYGNLEVKTPNIARIAAAGMRFNQFYVASPICSPSRVAYTTGMYPGRWRINDFLHQRKENAAHEQADWLDPKAPTIARTLKQAGYATAHFGKWHMGGGRDVQNAPLPRAYGFDEHHVNCEGCGPRIENFGSAKPQLVEGKMIARYEFTGFWIDKAIDFVNRKKDGPFYLEVWPQDVHTPHVPDPEELPKVADTPKRHHNFNAVLSRYDREIGRLLDYLKQAGLDENTIVVFASDNGPEPSFEHQRTAGLRGMKWSLYEGGVREPFIVRWPGHIAPGTVDKTSVVSSTDLLPTLCALANVPAPKDTKLDGHDISAALAGRPIERPADQNDSSNRNCATVALRRRGSVSGLITY